MKVFSKIFLFIGVLVIFSCNIPTSGDIINPSVNPPNNINGPVSSVGVPIEVAQDATVVTTLTLEGLVDVLDPVIFKYSVFSNPGSFPMTSPGFIFDEDAGTVSFTNQIGHGEKLIEIDFWTERDGLQSTPFRIYFKIVAYWA